MSGSNVCHLFSSKYGYTSLSGSWVVQGWTLVPLSACIRKPIAYETPHITDMKKIDLREKVRRMVQIAEMAPKV